MVNIFLNLSLIKLIFVNNYKTKLLFKMMNFCHFTFHLLNFFMLSTFALKDCDFYV